MLHVCIISTSEQADIACIWGFSQTSKSVAQPSSQEMFVPFGVLDMLSMLKYAQCNCDTHLIVRSCQFQMAPCSSLFATSTDYCNTQQFMWKTALGLNKPAGSPYKLFLTLNTTTEAQTSYRIKSPSV